ncbi:MAG: acyl-CoA/acyl-ACP dehydrogenase [Gammaproteobacteria bacterium]|nr:acyl-CoA/acyl-ACP dehydrogenase [Gammaproteobacteria bacterium]
MTDQNESTTARALAAAGDAESARDVGALDDVAKAVDQRLGSSRRSLVERLIYGPAPSIDELGSGGRLAREVKHAQQAVVDAALGALATGEAFIADGKLSATLRSAVAANKAYGYTVPVDFGGAGKRYADLAAVEETLAANGLGPMAVELSGQLTIGAGSILAYGNDIQQKTYLPMVAEGKLMAFGLTEVGVGVNAKKIQAYVEEDADGNYRLFADGPRNKLWITSAVHGGIVGIAAREGRDSKRIGLYIARLPEHDVQPDGEHDYEFRCESSGVAAFLANYNSRLHFHNFPIPRDNRIPGDGVEVLFYCLRMGRCMLAAMSSGYQRMLACDASFYAMQRIGVGGPVIRHEIPRLNIGRMLGGALMAKALCYMSLQQDSEGVDLAGLRDITKSAAATAGVESMIACEHVLGGRTFHRGSRVNEARVNLHLFGVVEGEDDLILMGMTRDVTQRFVDTYLASLLEAIQAGNMDANQQPLPPEQRLLRLTPATLAGHPLRSAAILSRLLTMPGTWRLGGWIVRNAVSDLVRLPLRLLPAAMFARYRALPAPLRPHARYAERKLRMMRWSYLGLSMAFQLELTRAQIPLQRFGKCVELLVSTLVTCHHAAGGDASEHNVARLQAQVLRDKYRAIRMVSGLAGMQATRDAVAAVASSVEQGQCSLIEDIKPEQFGHPWA